MCALSAFIRQLGQSAVHVADRGPCPAGSGGGKRSPPHDARDRPAAAALTLEPLPRVTLM